jgi:hypothetical protein
MTMPDRPVRTLAARSLARVAFAAMLACAGVLLLAGPASATYHDVGNHSFGSVASQCGGKGGDFYVSPDGGYGCIENSGGTLTSTECTAKGSCACQGPKCPAVVRRGVKGPRPPSATPVAARVRAPSQNKKPADAASHTRMSKH